MTVLDITRSPLLERVGALVAVWILGLETLCVLLPYMAVYFQLEMDEPTRAMIAQTQTTIQTVFIAVAAFFFGASVGTRQAADTANKQATANAVNAATIGATIAAAAPTPAKPDVTLKPGDSVEVSAESSTKDGKPQP